MTIAKDIKYFILQNFMTGLAYRFADLYAKTLRIEFDGMDALKQFLEAGGRVIFASWHQRIFGGFFGPQLFKRPFCIMMSRSRDGEFASNVVQRIGGWIPIRGSSSRGGAQALYAMIKGVLKYQVGVLIVDGPTGPPRLVKPGVIALAQKTHAAISLGLISYEKSWVLNSWDRFMIPKPFSRVLIRFVPPQPVPYEMNDEQFEALRRDIEEKLIRGYEEADNYWQNRKV
jgi:lysophospholipid acyltransferase (LPLAT)-like uncharacterized protein